MKVWFFWNVPGGFLSIICLLLAYCCKKYNKDFNFKFDSKFLLYFVIGFIAVIIATDKINISILLSRILLIYNVLIIYYIDYKYQKQILNYTINIFVIILLPSIVLFCMFLIGIDVFNGGTITNTELGYSLVNHYFFLSNGSSIRFQSIFCEPGHLATILPMLLLGTRYDFKQKKVLFLSFVVLMTFSLAGYILMFLGIIFTRIINGKIRLVKICRSVLNFIIVLVVGFSVFGKSAVIQELIISRILFDPERGTIAGNNRVTYQVDNYIETMSFKDKFWGGLNLEDYPNLMGTGIKIYMLQFGIVAIIFIFLFYFLLLKKRFSRGGVYILLIFSLSFLQRCYAIWFCQLVLYILLISMYFYEKNTYLVQARKLSKAN